VPTRNIHTYLLTYLGRPAAEYGSCWYLMKMTVQVSNLDNNTDDPVACQDRLIINSF